MMRSLARTALYRQGSRVRAYSEQLQVRDAYRSAFEEELSRDPTVIIMGEEVAKYDGAYKTTKGLVGKFGEDRVIDTPITEMGFAGLGVGAAMGGIRPVVEFMTFNFAMQAIDHIINSAAKTYYMSGGQSRCPIVFRGPNGPPTSVGAQHSQCFAAWYGSVPGLKVLAPFDSEDSRGLTKAAIRDDDPCVVLESELLYGQTFDISSEALDENFVLPIGQARVMREGNDVTMVSFSRGVGLCLEAAELLAKEGISAEVINLRTIRPMDREAILRSVAKTNRIVTVEEGWATCGIGAEIATTVCEFGFDDLDAPPQRVATADVPMAYSPVLEKNSMVNPDVIVAAAKRALYV